MCIKVMKIELTIKYQLNIFPLTFSLQFTTQHQKATFLIWRTYISTILLLLCSPRTNKINVFRDGKKKNPANVIACSIIYL